MIKTAALALATVVGAGCFFAVVPAGASVETPDYIVPDSSIALAGDAGVRMHTNFVISKRPSATALGPSSIPLGTTPTQILAAYNAPSGGGSNAIAIVDAYYYKNALSNFNTYSAAAGVPQETSTVATASTNKVFQVVYASGSRPPGNYGWAEEQALDIEVAHALAPGAKIYLVEAASASNTALYSAVKLAAGLPGVKEISMSWSGGEYSSETRDDSSVFGAQGVVYLAATGDSGKAGGTPYPAESKNVIGVGGTTLHFSGGSFTSETGWKGSGGGPSTYEPIPSFQSAVSSVVGSHRGAPDIAADADPNSGIGVYFNGSWVQVGGTSLATPLMAALINVANSGAANVTAEETKIYGNYLTSNLRDITSGNSGYPCKVGYDFVTGVGSPNGLAAF